jgi:hypothetical protein
MNVQTTYLGIAIKIERNVPINEWVAFHKPLMEEAMKHCGLFKIVVQNKKPGFPPGQSQEQFELRDNGEYLNISELNKSILLLFSDQIADVIINKIDCFVDKFSSLLGMTRDNFFNTGAAIGAYTLVGLSDRVIVDTIVIPEIPEYYFQHNAQIQILNNEIIRLQQRLQEEASIYNARYNEKNAELNACNRDLDNCNLVKESLEAQNKECIRSLKIARGRQPYAAEDAKDRETGQRVREQNAERSRKQQEEQQKAERVREQIRQQREADEEAERVRQQRQADEEAERVRQQRQADEEAERVRQQREAERLRQQREAERLRQQREAERLRQQREAEERERERLRQLQREAEEREAEERIRQQRQADEEAERLRQLQREAEEREREQREANEEAERIRQQQRELDEEAERIRQQQAELERKRQQAEQQSRGRRQPAQETYTNSDIQLNGINYRDLDDNCLPILKIMLNDYLTFKDALKTYISKNKNFSMLTKVLDNVIIRLVNVSDASFDGKLPCKRFPLWIQNENNQKWFQNQVNELNTIINQYNVGKPMNARLVFSGVSLFNKLLRIKVPQRGGNTQKNPINKMLRKSNTHRHRKGQGKTKNRIIRKTKTRRK